MNRMFCYRKMAAKNIFLYSLYFGIKSAFSLAAIESLGGSVAEWLACWIQAQKGPGSNRSRDAVG